MALPPGTRFGSYEVVGPIGAGGMGEVYHARGQRLDRAVAIKVLPDGFAADAERVARFDREASRDCLEKEPRPGSLVPERAS